MSAPPYSYGAISMKRLNTCHPYLIRLFEWAILYTDIIILCGERSKEEQDRAYDEGKSKVRYPNSKHNTTPERPRSLAVDFAPYPVDWKSIERFAWVAGQLKAGWEVLRERGEVDGILRFGCDWDGDGDVTDHSFMDWPHVELILN